MDCSSDSKPGFTFDFKEEAKGVILKSRTPISTIPHRSNTTSLPSNQRFALHDIYIDMAAPNLYTDDAVDVNPIMQTDRSSSPKTGFTLDFKEEAKALRADLRQLAPQVIDLLETLINLWSRTRCLDLKEDLRAKWFQHQLDSLQPLMNEMNTDITKIEGDIQTVLEESCDDGATIPSNATSCDDGATIPSNATSCDYVAAISLSATSWEDGATISPSATSSAILREKVKYPFGTKGIPTRPFITIDMAEKKTGSESTNVELAGVKLTTTRPPPPWEHHTSERKLNEEIKAKLRQIQKNATYPCRICGQIFRGPDTRENHYLKEHSPEERSSHNVEVLWCFFCQKYILKRSYRDHMDTHNIDQPWVCNICGKGCKSQKNLTQHMHLHTRKYACDVCGRACRGPSNLLKHMMCHQGKREHVCNICEKAYTTKAQLKVHKKTHSGEKPFQCDRCGKTLCTYQSLQRHKVLHTGVKPFKCKICGIAFAWPEYLLRHTRQHTGEKPY